MEPNNVVDDRHICLDCKLYDESMYLGGNNYYMVQKEIWKEFGAGKDLLCIPCLEKRLNRKLRFEDFTDCIANNVNKHIQSLKINKVSIMDTKSDRTIPAFNLDYNLIQEFTKTIVEQLQLNVEEKLKENGYSLQDVIDGKINISKSVQQSISHPLSDITEWYFIEGTNIQLVQVKYQFYEGKFTIYK